MFNLFIALKYGTKERFFFNDRYMFIKLMIKLGYQSNNAPISSANCSFSIL